MSQNDVGASFLFDAIMEWLSAGMSEEKQYIRLARGVLIESIVNVKISKSQFETKYGLVLFAKQFHAF